MNIRRGQSSDVPALLELMKRLAEFEGYFDRFAVTQRDLIERGFAVDRSEFVVWVAEHDDRVRGYALAYVIPFTYDLRPTVVLKELFVEATARNGAAGGALFAAVADYGRSINARLLRWQVLPNNESAKRFYRRQGGGTEVAWENWMIDLDA